MKRVAPANQRGASSGGNLEDVDAGELATIENRGAPLAFKEGQPQKHDHLGTEMESVGHKFGRRLERRIRQYRLNANGQLML